MSKTKRLKREQILSIVEKRKEGKSNEAIAAELGVHTQTVIRWTSRLRSAGHEVPKRKSGFAKVDLSK